MRQTATEAERLNRLQAVIQADGIRGNEARMELASEYALNAPWMTPASIIAAVKVAHPDRVEATAPSAPARATAKQATLPDAGAVYAARRTQRGAAQ